MLGAGIHLHGDGAAFGVGEGGFEGFRKAPAQILAHLDAIDHHLDAVTAVLVEHRQVVEFMDDAIHAYPHEALGAQFDEQVGLLALAPADHRGDDHQLGLFGQGQYRVHHLRDALGLEGVLGVVGAVGRAGARVEQAQVVVDLGDGAHRGARVVAGGLLLDGDRRREAFDEVHVGLFHELQELPRVGRQGFHIAPLALGVKGVEGQRGLAGAGQAGDHRELVAGDVEGDVFEVVGAGTADFDRVHGAFGAEGQPVNIRPLPLTSQHV